MRHLLVLSFALGAALVARPAGAARLLLPDELSPGVAPVSGAPSATSAVPLTAPPSFGVHFGVAAGAGAIGVPVGFLLANFLGNLSISLIPTALLGLIPMGLVAPTFTALAAWLFGNWNLTDADGRFSFWLGFLAASVVHIAATVVAGFIGVSLAGIPGLILFSVVDGALMGGATVGFTRLLRKSPAPAALLELPSHSPAVSATTVVPLTTIPF